MKRVITASADNIERLQQHFPAAFRNGRIDFDVLRELLGAAVDDREETFGLNWHGKRRARQLALAPYIGTLRPCPADSVAWDTTRNMIVEGDNLEVLKVLQESHAGQVKLIYIDPPYNTGNSFVYPDTFSDSIGKYLRLTGRTDNAETNGRYHTNWLNMMYPRLLLARGLLRDDGVLFVSIGDEEVHNLRLLCDEVFGGDNFCGMFVWEKKKKPSFLKRNMGSVTEYIVAYARDRSRSPAFAAGVVTDGKKYPFNNAGNGLSLLHFPARSVRLRCDDQCIKAQDMSAGNIKTVLLDDVVVDDGRNANTFRLEGEWRYSQQTLDELVASGADIVISKVPFRPNHIKRSGEAKKTANLLSYRVNGVPTNEDARAEMRATFGADVMSYPKPSGLLQYLVRAVTSADDVILDFFAGLGTTGVGTLLQNAEDEGRRRFILVQLPEPLDPARPEQKAAAEFCAALGKPLHLAELTKERLRRAAKEVRERYPHFRGDGGFRVFKLNSNGNVTVRP
jgi:adenine-specific DNA-methyltransferase